MGEISLVCQEIAVIIIELHGKVQCSGPVISYTNKIGDTNVYPEQFELSISFSISKPI